MTVTNRAPRPFFPADDYVHQSWAIGRSGTAPPPAVAALALPSSRSPLGAARARPARHRLARRAAAGDDGRHGRRCHNRPAERPDTGLFLRGGLVAAGPGHAG